METRIEFLQTNWLTSSGITGLIKLLEYNEIKWENFVNGNKLFIPKEVWDKIPYYYANYLWDKFKNTNRIFSFLNNFYNNSRLVYFFKNWQNIVLKTYCGIEDKKRIKEYVEFFSKIPNLEKDIFEFDKKLVNRELFEFVLQSKGTLLKFEEEYKEKIKKVKGRNKLKVVEEFKEKPLIAQINSLGIKANETVFKDLFIKELEKIMRIEIPKEMEEELPRCWLCQKREAYLKENGEINALEEKNFTPLLASSKTMVNFFPNGINYRFLCKDCEILLYLSALGFTPQNGKYLYVYLPLSIKLNYEINSTLNSEENSFFEFLKSITYKKMEWALSNIFFVELEFFGKNNANIYTFHIPYNVAKTFKTLNFAEFYPQTLNKYLKDLLITLDERKSIYNIIWKIYKETFYPQQLGKKNNNKLLPQGLIFLLYLENAIKNGGRIMEDEKELIEEAYEEGQKIKKMLWYEYKNDKKLETYSYKLLDVIRRKDKAEFLQIIGKLYLNLEKPLPQFFVEILDNDKKFINVANAFFIGLNSYIPKKEEKN
jgi:CRISPR-associated protein Cas8b1/Cst1 subtype I-B